MTTALLIIDVQSALCSGEHAVFESQRVIERVNQVSAKARNAGSPVILVQHESPRGTLERGSDGWRFAPGLVVENNDLVLAKTTADAFHRTALHDELQRRGATHLIVCGMQSDFCVDTTIRRALALGYPVTLVSDAHSTSDNGILKAAQISAHHTATLANISSFGPRVTPRAAAEVEV